MPAEIPKGTICVAGAQMPVTNDIDANVAAITRAIEFARSRRARILLTPEGSLSGYTHRFNVRAVKKALSVVTAEAQKAGLGLALGTCFLEPGDKRCYNQIRFYNPDGRYLGYHSKMLTCATLKKPFDGEIRHFVVSPMRIFNFGGIRIGGLICNDLWANPLCTPRSDLHLSQRLSQRGALIIFHAVNGARTGDQWSRVAWHFHDANLRMRARAGRIWIVTVDNCSPAHLRCSSQTGVVSPEGEWVCRTGQKGEQCFAFTINLAGKSTKQ